MTLYVRLRGPQVTLQRQKRGCLLVPSPKIWKWGLLASLVCFVVGFFIIKEVQKIKHANSSKVLPPLRLRRVQSFAIKKLLSGNTPGVELSAQITLNALHFLNNKRDVLRYYEQTRCGETSQNGSDCEKFSLVEKSSGRSKWWALSPCSLYPKNLVRFRSVPADQFLLFDKMEASARQAIKLGGWWEPETCLPRYSVAVIVPYRNRCTHLITLMSYLHPMLQRQKLRYKIFVVEQFGNSTFNKGVLMNAGFLEALKEELFHCFIFHDVDLIPETEYNMYSCPDMPRHLSVAVNELDYELPYLKLVGGAFAIKTDHFFRVNGYSNFYWGWGGEDDDMGIRILHSGLKITRPLSNIGRYTMIKHVKRKPSSFLIRQKLLVTSKDRYKLEGLNSVQYKIVKKQEYPWFTTFAVDVGKPHPSFNIK